jgi:signal peptidase
MLILNSGADRVDIIRQFLTSKNFWVSTAREFLFAIAFIAVIAGVLFAYSGAWPPLVSVNGLSMYPHMQDGDLILIQKLAPEQIQTYDEAKQTGYQTFDGYGDVLVYRPFGRTDMTPVIHRAISRVNASGPMWTGSSLAPNDGFVTQGDNNYLFDQSCAICPNTPVQDDWILGVARFRIPYLGYVRSVLSIFGL